jgi:hypothetical protein
VTTRAQPEREIRPGITVQDAEDALAAIDAYRRRSLNATKRVAQRVIMQGNGAGFITALTWVANAAIDAFGEDGQADAWWAFFKDGLTASLADEVVI